MANWLEFLVDAAPLKAIYGQDVPSLHGVDFHGLELHRDGPTVLFKFDLPEYPKRPPSKWVAAGCDRVQVRLLAVGVQEFKMAGLQRNCRLAVGLTKIDGRIRLLGEGSGMTFDLSADHLLVDGVSAYRSE